MGRSFGAAGMRSPPQAAGLFGQPTATRPQPDEVAAQHLMPGDRIRRGNALWSLTRVAVTCGGPVSVRMRKVVDGVVTAAEIEVEMVADEIVGVR